MKEEIINAFKKSIFPYGFFVEKESEEESDEESMLENEEADEETDEETELDSSIKEKSLKILTPNQMLSRLPISLAQLKARNNSAKLKNEIRQLLYSLYISKKFTKQIYKSLIDII